MTRSRPEPFHCFRLNLDQNKLLFGYKKKKNVGRNKSTFVIYSKDIYTYTAVIYIHSNR